VCTRGRALISLDLAGAAASSDNACPVILASKRMWPHALRGRRAPDARCAGGARSRLCVSARIPPEPARAARLSLCERVCSSQVFQSLSMGVLS